MQNNKKIIIWVIMLLLAIGCTDKLQESSTIEPSTIEKEGSQKQTILTQIEQRLDDNNNFQDSMNAFRVIEQAFGKIGSPSPARFLIPRNIITNSRGSLLLKSSEYEDEERNFTTVDNYTYTNDGLLFRKVDLAKAIKSDRRVGRLYEGKYFGFSIPYYKHHLPKEKWQAAESIIKSFGWVHFEYSDGYHFAMDSKLLGQNKVLPITINEKVKELLQQGVLSCYYENDNLVQFEYFDRLFDPSNSDSSFYFGFLINEPHLYIQKAPNSIVTSDFIDRESPPREISISTGRKGLLYKNKQLIRKVNPNHLTFAKKITNKDTIEADSLITKYYEPLIAFIQQVKKRKK